MNDSETHEEREERHRQVYGTPGLPPFSFRSIGSDGRLWHGRNPLTARDIAQLADEIGITHILDLRERWEWAAPGRFGLEAVNEIEARGLRRLHLPVVDTLEPSDETFTQAVAFLNEAMAQPGSRIYVHCRMGLERTGAVLAAWRAQKYDLSVGEAVKALQADGAKIDPLPHQKKAAQRWLRRMKNL